MTGPRINSQGLALHAHSEGMGLVASEGAQGSETTISVNSKGQEEKRISSCLLFK